MTSYCINLAGENIGGLLSKLPICQNTFPAKILAIRYDCYPPLLPMFHTVPVPVRFNQTTYHVAEGVNSYAVITLEALAIRTKSFYVWVTTQDGSAVGEHRAICSPNPNPNT